MSVLARIFLVALALLPTRALAAPLGQWVWTRRDVDVLADARAARADVLAAVHVGEIDWDGRAPRLKLRLAPSVAPDAVAIVVRLHRSLERLMREPAAASSALAEPLARALSLARSAGYAGSVLQLDYDSPVRGLAAWASILRTLARDGGVLAGWQIWTTSLVAHVRDPRFGSLFEGVVAGHIVQVFGTGERYDAAVAVRLASLLTRAGLPYYLGLGAFERTRDDALLTSHGAWHDVAVQLADSPLYRGTWVFTAGQRWGPLARSLP